MIHSEHEDICLEKFGERFEEIHRFLDQYFADFGIWHRRIFHHTEGIKLIVEKFGQEARKAAEQHIIDDIGHIPKDWNSVEIFDIPLVQRQNFILFKHFQASNFKH